MDLLKSFKQVTTFVFDVDGVLTDGSVLLLENGLQARTMNIKDGLALQMALQNGYRVIIISGGYSEPVLKRLQYLGLKEIFLGVKDKLGFLKSYAQEQGLNEGQMLFMGDDLPDVPVLQHVGMATCPADAVAEVKAASHYIATAAGGKACVREVIEKVLKLNHHWQYQPGVVSK